ncbi:MAG TPA: PAS domain-containing protein [Candidatus Brocadiaceae bacterium]
MFTKRYSSKSESTHLSTPSLARKVVSKGHTYRTSMRKTREKLNSIFNAITDPIIVFDAEFNVIKINKAAKEFFTGCPIGKKCFFTKHKFALACKNCPTWQTLKTGVTTTSEILNPKTGTTLLLKTYPIYNRLKNIKGVVLVGRESDDVPMKWNR